MDWLYTLFMGEGIAHTLLVLSLVITVGIMLSKVKICGISLGVTWILFVGIAAGHFGMTVDHNTLHFIKEFGLVLFVMGESISTSNSCGGKSTLSGLYFRKVRLSGVKLSKVGEWMRRK